MATKPNAARASGGQGGSSSKPSVAGKPSATTKSGKSALLNPRKPAKSK